MAIGHDRGVTTQDTIVLNDFGGTVLSQRTRTSSAGKATVRYTLDIKATPILNTLNGVDMGKGPAFAIRDLLEAQTLAISQPAAPATVLKRRQAAAALARGEAWATRRYTGGRTGLTRPGTGGANGAGNTFGNDSGRLARGYFVMQNPKEGSWTVNVPANRLDPSTWNGSGFEAFVSRFVQLVPALGNPRSILNEESFVRAVAQSHPVKVLTGANAEVWRTWLKAARDIVGIGNRTLDIAGMG